MWCMTLIVFTLIFHFNNDGSQQIETGVYRLRPNSDMVRRVSQFLLETWFLSWSAAGSSPNEGGHKTGTRPGRRHQGAAQYSADKEPGDMTNTHKEGVSIFCWRGQPARVV
ncbi:hypothetical protein DFH07DRAFT_774214 [Mycena maculata]|uniref:Secreted protein n=1 Tax=Mycena maculata TaxID=230809 RepID=A0AAD7NBA5_9AGAR|nr:hypothetical protein DFH07DRAFT_774214 [Mycena maculata]